MNHTCLMIYDVLDNAMVLEAKFDSTLEDLERNEESRMRMEAVEASRGVEFARIQDENKNLKRKLRDS